MSFDDIPTMKELNTRYRRLALLKHPDKNGGSDTSKEEYQQLQKFYKSIGNYIIENDTSVCDDEERDHFEAFKNFNFDKKNKLCHTVLIENKLTSSWKQVLCSKLGEPENKGKGPGLIYKVPKYSVNDDLFDITVTLYEVPKDNKSKLHVQGQSQLANDEYIRTELPRLYEEVRKIQPPETIGAGAGVGDADGDNDVQKERRGRSGKQTAKSMKTVVKDLVKRCQVRSCEFTTKLDKNMTIHNQTHQREKVLNLQRNITDDEMEVEVEKAVVDRPTRSAKPFDFHVQANLLLTSQQEKDKLKREVEEKNKVLGELEERIFELEKERGAKIKKYEKELKLKDDDLKQMTEEYKKTVEKASLLCEENTLLKEKVKTFQNREIVDLQIQQKYEEIVNVTKASAGCQTEELDEDENIEALVVNKEAGYRRTDPTAAASAPAAISQRAKESPEVHQCDLCDVKCSSEHNLKTHISRKHHQCDICERVLKTPDLLRSHLREIHDKSNGTMMHCSECKFSALNEQHLKIHTERHHNEMACNQCDFKTRSRTKLMEHVARRHRRARNITCKYWLEGRCNRVHCLYEHRRASEKPSPARNSRQPWTSPWSNPAFLDGEQSLKSFPFLERSCQCRSQSRPRGM